MRISARSDYAIRAMAHLADASPAGDRAIKADEIAQAQGIPLKFLLEILRELRNDDLVHSQRGSEGGYSLARPAAEITLADILRALEGPLVTVHETSLSELSYPAPAGSLVEVWMAMRAALRSVFDQVTLAALVAGELPPAVRRLAQDYRESFPVT
jgi:Rrf2 family protein